MYKERLDRAWKKVTIDWVEGTMELAITLWEARNSLKQNGAFGNWLAENGYGENVISHQDRSGLMNLGAPECRELARKTLMNTNRHNWENIWSKEVKPLVIDHGLRQPVLRKVRKTNIEPSTTEITIPQQPASRNTEQKEKELLQQLNEKDKYKAWMEIGDAPIVGRMPDDAQQQIYGHIREINQHCHELFQLSLYVDQMSEGAKHRLAVEFMGIKKWGQVLAERMMGHKRLSEASAPACDINVSFRRIEN